MRFKSKFLTLAAAFSLLGSLCGFSIDTTIYLRVFYPNPLSSSNTSYGNPLKDFNDANLPLFASEYRIVSCKAVFKNDSFVLASPFLSFAEISKPYHPLPVLATDSFLAFRNQPLFEQAMSFFHLSTFISFLDSLGFSHFIDTVVIDAHAFDGADLSALNPLTSPHQLELGTGGVDDAEDPDVIIHEYGHGILSKFNKPGTPSAERKTLDEALCDFLAAWYHFKLTQEWSPTIFKWDGHNEFWSGRTLYHEKKYPLDWVGDPQKDGTLFAGALYRAGLEMPPDSLAKRVLYMIPQLTPNTSLNQAAQLILDADVLLNTNGYHWPLVKNMKIHGFLPNLNYQNTHSSPSFSYFFSAESLVVHTDFQPLLYDLNGRKWGSFQQIDQDFILPIAHLSKGIYILKVANQSALIIFGL